MNSNVVLGLVIATLVIYVVFDARVFTEPQMVYICPKLSAPRAANATPPPPSDFDLFGTCKLTVFDPFYRDIGRTWRIQDPTLGCDKSVKPIVTVTNNTISIRSDADSAITHCNYRCHNYMNPMEYDAQDWKTLKRGEAATVECDFIRTQCMTRQGAEKENYIHATIFETNKSTVKVEKYDARTLRPGIHIVLVDSVSSTQARRSFPRTLHYLLNELEGVQFHHLNKVGENSMPNAFAFLMGWRIVDSNREIVGAPNLVREHSLDEVCSQYRDNDSVIFREFEKIGYKTLYSDEYSAGSIFTWPSCKGYMLPETNHLFRPLVMTLIKEHAVAQNMNARKCYELHKAMLEYHASFLHAYKGDWAAPLTELTWIATLSHDDSNAVQHTDVHFEEFFRQNAAALENSFVFFMADHGMRVGALLKTELGKREINNPMLHVVVPKWLRGNDSQTLRNLRSNSQKLVTQYDVYATLVDILQQAKSENFTSFDAKSIFDDEQNTNNATSLLRPFPPRFEQRNCRNIPTDFSFCLCEYSEEPVNDEALGKALAEFGAQQINAILASEGLGGRCHSLAADKVISTSAYAPAAQTRIYISVFRATPGNGEFRVTVKALDDGSLRRVSDVVRQNAYGTAAMCVTHTHPHHRPLCECKK